jgi:hypothetical protein
MPRILFDTMMFVSLLVLPFPVTLGLVVVGMLTFARFWEMVALVILSDLLYRGTSEFYIFEVTAPLIILTFATFLAVEYLRSILRARQA